MGYTVLMKFNTKLLLLLFATVLLETAVISHQAFTIEAQRNVIREYQSLVQVLNQQGKK